MIFHSYVSFTRGYPIKIAIWRVYPIFPIFPMFPLPFSSSCRREGQAASTTVFLLSWKKSQKCIPPVMEKITEVALAFPWHDWEGIFRINMYIYIKCIYIYTHRVYIIFHCLHVHVHVCITSIYVWMSMYIQGPSPSQGEGGPPAAGP